MASDHGKLAHAAGSLHATDRLIGELRTRLRGRAPGRRAPDPAMKSRARPTKSVPIGINRYRLVQPPGISESDVRHAGLLSACWTPSS